MLCTKKIHLKLFSLFRELKEKELFCTDLQSRQKAQEEELALFRKLSAENVYTGNQVFDMRQTVHWYANPSCHFNMICRLPHCQIDSQKRTINSLNIVKMQRMKLPNLRMNSMKLLKSKIIFLIFLHYPLKNRYLL